MSERLETYRVIETRDMHNCDTCGLTLATGYNVTKNGKLVLELKPVAHCCSPTTWGWEDLVQRLGDVLGVKIIVDGYRNPDDE